MAEDEEIGGQDPVKEDGDGVNPGDGVAEEHGGEIHGAEPPEEPAEPRSPDDEEARSSQEVRADLGLKEENRRAKPRARRSGSKVRAVRRTTAPTMPP